MSTMPEQKPGRSKQDYGTPREFVRALERKLHIEAFAIDLAASDDNAICDVYYTEKEDALVQSWVCEERWSFCNPPYAAIEPWVSKACIESAQGAHIAMLLPAGVGSNWWAKFVHERCYVLLQAPRLQFVGTDNVYPKDLVTLLYTPVGYTGYSTWRWK